MDSDAINDKENVLPTPGSRLETRGNNLSDNSNKMTTDVKLLDNKYSKILIKTKLIKRFLNNFDDYYNDSIDENVLIEKLSTNLGISKCIPHNFINYPHIHPEGKEPQKSFGWFSSNGKKNVEDKPDEVKSSWLPFGKKKAEVNPDEVNPGKVNPEGKVKSTWFNNPFKKKRAVESDRDSDIDIDNESDRDSDINSNIDESDRDSEFSEITNQFKDINVSNPKNDSSVTDSHEKKPEVGMKDAEDTESNEVINLLKTLGVSIPKNTTPSKTANPENNSAVDLNMDNLLKKLGISF